MSSLIREKRRIRRKPEYLPIVLRRTPENILNIVCLQLGVSKLDVLGDSRAAKVIKAKAIFSYICRERGIGSTEIGEAINRDHACAIYHYRKYKELLDETKPWYDENLAAQVRAIQKLVNK